MASIVTTQAPFGGLQFMPPPFSPLTIFIFDVCVYMLAAGSFAALGIFSNVINFIIFCRQGILSSSSNVSLAGLSISNFFSSLVTLARILVLYFVYFAEDGKRESTSYSISIIISAYIGPFVQMTCWITAYMSFERVMCILFPFKVKSIFTPARSFAVVSAILIGTFILDSPCLYKFYLNWNFSSLQNASYMDFYETNIFSNELYRMWTFLSPISLRFTAIFIVTVCNAILLWKVSLSQKFRKSTGPSSMSKSSGSSGKESATNSQTESKTKKEMKDRKLLRMITIVSAVFMACYFAGIPHSIIFSIIWRRNIDYHFYHLYISWVLIVFLQIINASVNIFIYYKMSSRYKEEFDKLFCVKSAKGDASFDKGAEGKDENGKNVILY